MAVRELDQTSAGRFLVDHKFSFELNVAAGGKMFDENAASYDLVWGSGGGETSQIVSMLVSIYNTSPATYYLRAQVPESYPSDPFSLASWKLLSGQSKRPVSAKGGRRGQNNRLKRGRGRNVDDFASQCLVVKPRQTVVRVFKGWSNSLRPRWTNSGPTTSSDGGFGVHLLSFVPFFEGVSDSGVAMPTSGASLTFNISVRCRTTRPVEGEVLKGAFLRQQDGWQHLDFVDPYPAIAPKVHDLNLKTGNISYAKLKQTTGKQICLEFYDSCGEKTLSPVGLNSEYVYFVPLSIVDEIQGSQKETVALFNQIGFVSGGWYYGDLTYDSTAKEAKFTARVFASDPGKKMMSGEAQFSVASRKQSIPSPKIQGLYVKKFSQAHVAIGRIKKEGGLYAGYSTVAVTPITVLIFVYRVLQLAVSYWDKPPVTVTKHARWRNYELNQFELPEQGDEGMER